LRGGWWGQGLDIGLARLVKLKPVLGESDNIGGFVGAGQSGCAGGGINGGRELPVRGMGGKQSAQAIRGFILGQLTGVFGQLDGLGRFA